MTVCAVPFVAVIVTAFADVTVLVVTVKVAVVLPGATVTVPGTVATDVRLLESATTTPPVGAAPESVTVPVDGAGPLTVVGFRLSALTVGTLTVKFAVRAAPYVAEMVAVAVVATGLLVTVNVADVAFAGIVTLAGTLAAAVLLLDRVTTAPLAGAGPLKVTAPIEEAPPMTAVGFRLNDVRVAATTVNVVVRVAL
jgi:hypothetical protein